MLAVVRGIVVPSPYWHLMRSGDIPGRPAIDHPGAGGGLKDAQHQARLGGEMVFTLLFLANMARLLWDGAPLFLGPWRHHRRTGHRRRPAGGLEHRGQPVLRLYYGHHSGLRGHDSNHRPQQALCDHPGDDRPDISPVSLWHWQ